MTLKVAFEEGRWWVRDEHSHYSDHDTEAEAQLWCRVLEADTTGQPAYFADVQRHLVCVPYGRAELRAMADALDIKRHWWHAGRLAHIDIPARQLARILTDPRVTVATPRQILEIVQGGE